jgi:hypothetical protein
MVNTGQNTSVLGLTRVELWSVVTTAGLAIALIITAGFSYERSPLVLAVALGSVGGLMHELAQSGGKIFFFAKKDDGLYLGSVAGMLLGGVTGVIAAHATPGGTVADYQNLAYEAFMAGLGMKGLVEAAAGTPVGSASGAGQPPVPGKLSTLQALPAAPVKVEAPSF